MSSEIAGYLHSGRIEKGRPETLREWRVTTNQLSVAENISKLLGGTIKEQPTSDVTFEILTTSSTIATSIARKDVAVKMVDWDQSKVVHHCDGWKSLQPGEGYGQPCGCPTLLSQIRARARKGIGPQPDAKFTLHLTAAVELGPFQFTSTSWGMLEAARKIIETGKEGRYELSLSKKKAITRTGRAIQRFEPTLRHLRSAF